jgi:cellulose synthase/poly-beta-1,6-N-acetylglucosamine synthase-like glycosyltransferase
MPSLDQALRAASPRYTPPPTPIAAWAIHGAIAALWIALLARACIPNGLFAWSAGLVYVLYDTALLIFTFAGTLPLTRKQPAPLPSPVRLNFAVLIAAHNEAGVLAATLDALRAQTEPADEIVLVDDGSTDASAAVLAAYGLGEPALDASTTNGSLRWLRLAHRGKAAAMNRALGEIDADVVMTVDADTILDPQAVGAMRAAFAEARLVAATGVLAPICAGTRTGRMLQWFQAHEYLRNFLSRYAWMRQDGLLLISGAFAGFRLAPVLEVGGFDPNCLVEDYELIHRLRRFSVLHQRGWTTAVLGGARARTDAPSTAAAFLRQRRRWFGGFLQTQYWYRDMVGNPAYGRLGTWMLPVKAADTLQPLYGLSALVLLIVYLATGHWRVLLPVGGVILAKIVFDLAFYVWSVRLYRNWVSTSGQVRFGSALVAAIVEPFTFQLLRHLGACLGWASLLTGQMRWGHRHERQSAPDPAL